MAPPRGIPEVVIVMVKHCVECRLSGPKLRTIASHDENDSAHGVVVFESSVLVVLGRRNSGRAGGFFVSCDRRRGTCARATHSLVRIKAQAKHLRIIGYAGDSQGTICLHVFGDEDFAGCVDVHWREPKISLPMAVGSTRHRCLSRLTLVADSAATDIVFAN